jgi:hypothetical protein
VEVMFMIAIKVHFTASDYLNKNGKPDMRSIASRVMTFA